MTRLVTNHPQNRRPIAYRSSLIASKVRLGQMNNRVNIRMNNRVNNLPRHTK